MPNDLPVSVDPNAAAASPPARVMSGALPAAADGAPALGPDRAHVPPSPPVDTDALASLQAFVQTGRRLFVLTGAGCSTESGIADYRDTAGAWKRPMPTTFKTFTEDSTMRARYWARSMIGWRGFGAARPNQAHRTLAEWEREGRIELLVTQNVDGLHQAAGARSVLDLHGRLDNVVCLRCGANLARDTMQRELEARNPAWIRLEASLAPDGDADLENAPFETFDVPQHEACGGGMWKPDVVFFGEAVPRPRVDRALDALARVDGLLILGSSLMVFSGYRFALAAAERGIPIAAVNIGHTRADPLLAVKVEDNVSAALRRLA